MKKIRIGNDFVFNWAIERGGLPEDLLSVLEKHLHLSVFGKRVELIEGVDYDITGNVIRIEVTPTIANILGTYKAEFHYILPDNGLIDEDRKCAVDVDAFKIVSKTAQADDSTEFSMTSDMAIAFKGDKGDSAYQVWLEEGNTGTEEDYFAYLRQPAIDAGASISEATTAANSKILDIENRFQSLTIEQQQDGEVIDARDGELSLKAKINSIEDSIEDLVVNVKEFGAVGDANYFDDVNKKYYKDQAFTIPATDDSPAFIAARDYLISKGGGTIFIPLGTYLIKESIIWQTNLSMVGSGMGVSTLVVEGSIFSLIRNTEGVSNGSSASDDSVWLNDCKFENFGVDLIGLTHPDASVEGKAFFILYMRRARFSNLYLRNTIGTALGCDFLVDTVIDKVVVERAGRNAIGYGGNSGIGIGTCALEEEPVIVSNCHLYNCGNYGIFVETQNNPSGITSQHAQIINNFCDGSKFGIGNKGSGGTLISGNSCINNISSGIHLSQPSNKDIVINNKINDNGGDGIYIGSTYKGDLMIQGNAITGNGGRGIIILNAVDLDAIAGRVKGIFKISNNLILNNGAAGVDIGGNVNNISINDNSIFNNGRSVPSSYSAGILINGNMNTVDIINNQIVDNQDVPTQYIGIKAQSAINILNSVIRGNNIIGYTYNTAINFANASTKEGTVISDNTGYISELSGDGDIAEGVDYVYIDFPKSMADTPKLIYLSTGGNERIWYNSVSRLGFKVNRELKVGVLKFSWKAEL